MKQPLFARVVVVPVPVERKTAGGIDLPDTINTRPIEGHALRVGPQVTHVRPGDKVYYSKYAGSDMRIDVDGKPTDVVVIEERDILGRDPVSPDDSIEQPETA